MIESRKVEYVIQSRLRSGTEWIDMGQTDSLEEAEGIRDYRIENNPYRVWRVMRRETWATETVIS